MASVLVLAFARGAFAGDMTVSGKNTSAYNYAGRVTFTVQGCEGTVKDFPLYVRVSEEAIPGFSYDMIRETPKTNDIVFLDSTGLSLDYEIEKWDVRGESGFWVKVPTLNNGTTVTMCWNLRDGCTKPARNDPKAVWADYTGVWHFGEAIGQDVAANALSGDSTGNGRAARPVTYATGAGDLRNQTYSGNGVFGNARHNSYGNPVATKGCRFEVDDSEKMLLGTNFTVTGWFKSERVAGGTSLNGAILVSRKGAQNEAGGWYAQMMTSSLAAEAQKMIYVQGSGSKAARVKISEQTFQTAGWTFMAVTYDGAKVSIGGGNKQYCSGTGTIAAATDNRQKISFGNFCSNTSNVASFDGYFDEFRIRLGSVTNTCLEAEFAQGTNRNFCAAGNLTNDTAAVLKNEWKSEPSVTKTVWEYGTRPQWEDFNIDPAHGTLDDVTVVIYDRATGAEVGRGTGWDFGSTIPSAPGSYRVEIAVAQNGSDATGIWGALDYTLGFRIAANGGSHAFNDNVARILLGNDDYSVAGGEVEWQGYDDEDRYDGLPYWQHLDADGTDASTTYCEYWSDSYDFNLGGGTHHIYRYGDAIDRLWDLRDIRIGNTFNNGEILEERSGKIEVDKDGLAPDQNYLPWNRDSQRVLGHVTGEPVEGYHRYAGHVVMQNTTNAAVTSTCYTNGIGTIYFDAVNGFTHNVTNGVGEANYRLVVEIATNKVGTALPPTERWVSFNACEDITVGLADAAREPFFGADWVQWKGLRVLRFDGGQCTDLGTADAVDLKIEEGGGYGRFYRVIVPVNLTPATGGIRFRIRRVAIDRTQSYYPDGSAYILLDNVICSTPTPCVQLQPYGRFFQQTQPGDDVAQGWEGAFVPAFPSVADTNVCGRAKASMTDGSAMPAGIVASATMHYRWHYIEQQTTEWREADLDPVTLVARDPLALPALFQGDIDFWFDAVQHGHYYAYADYSGTGLKLGDSGYSEEISAVTNGVGKGWFVRTREGRSDYAEMKLLVKTSEDAAAAELPLSVVKDGLWRGYYRMTNGVDGIWWRIEARDEQTDGATDWNWSTNRWYVADWTEEPPTFPAAGRMSEGTTNSWSRMTCDRQTDYLMFQVDETTLGVTAIHAAYQNFNRWSGADKGYFVGASTDTNSTSMAGTSPDVREYSMSYASWADTPSVNTNWNLNFNDHTIGESVLFKGYTTFASFNDYFTAWQIGKGMWVYGKYLDPASHVALQMAGNGEGYAEFSNRTILGDNWPRGLESVSFHSRLAQVVSPELMAYNMVGVMQENERYVNITPTMLLTNYTFMARTCFDMQKNQGFSGNASVSLFAYYKPGTGAYEARWEQIAGYLPPAGGDYDGKTLGPKPQGQRLVISRWEASGSTYQETVLYAVTNSGSFNVDMPTMPYADGVTATNNLMPFLISVYKQGEDTIVLAGIRTTEKSQTSSKHGGVSWNASVDGMPGSWYIACVRDKSSKQLEGGAYGVLSANCEGMFLTPQWRDGMTYPSDVLPSALGTKAYSNKTLNSVAGYADSYNEMKLGWWGMNRGRTKMLYDAHSGKSQPFGFTYVPASQTIKVLAKPLDSKDGGWTNAKLLGQVTVSDFGHPFTEPDHKPTFYYTPDSKLRLQTGGDLDDFRRDVVINDIEIRQWRGYDSDQDANQYYKHTNFVFTSGWITNGAAQLSAKRTAVGTPCAIRSPLFDGDYGNGNGIGDFSFTYREPQKNIRLLVQIATNVTGSSLLQSLTESVQTDGDGNRSWHTVTNLTYADLWPSAPEKGDTRTWTQPFSYHGAKGLVRVLVDPKLVEEVSPLTWTNTAAFGAIDVTGVLCFDEPSLAKGCWWGWNLQTIGKGYTETKDEQKRMYLPDYAGNERNGRSLALNNSVTDDIDPDAKDPNAFRKHMPFLQSPIFTNIIGQISFKARKFENSDYAPAAQVVVYGAADSPVSLEDKDWEYIAAFPITNTIYTTYTCKTDSRNFYALRLAVVDVPGTPPRPEGPTWKTSPQRVLLDEVSVSEAVRAMLAFRNVGAFRSNLDDNSIVTGVTTRVQQPLCDENWGVQAEVFATMLGDEIDKDYPPRVKLHWYVGKEPWGYANWKKRESGSAYLAQADGSNYVFRSSYKTCPGAVMPAQTEPGTVVQYMLEVVYQTINASTPGETPTKTLATNWLDSVSWTVPEWYAPVDYNADPDYGAGRTFAAFNILDTVAPGWAWLNEANVFGTKSESGANSDEQFQYVEVCVPVEADLSGWRLRMLEAGVYNDTVTTNWIAKFGKSVWDQAAGTKKGNLGAKYNMVFRCLGNKESAQLSKADGTLDGVWEFSAYTSLFRNRGGVDCVYDVEMPFGVQLVRPTGIIESSIVIVGTNRWGRLPGYREYDPSNIVAKLNQNVPGSKFFYAAEDCCGTFRSASVMDGRGESAGVWTNDWACSPGYINTNWGGKVEQKIDPDHPTPHGDSIIVTATIDLSGGPIRQWVGGKGSAQTNATEIIILKKGSDRGTNIVYQVDPWYEIAPVTTNGAVFWYEPRRREKALTVGKGASNNLEVVARAQADSDLRDKYGLTKDNPFTPAVLDWLHGGSTMYGPFAHEDGIGLAEYWEMSGRCVTNMTLSQMYCLDMDPTVSNLVFQAGMVKNWPEVAGVDPLEEPVPGYKGQAVLTNVKMRVFMMISNKVESVAGPGGNPRRAWSPYILRGYDPNFTSWDYADNVYARAWTSETFKVTGILANGLTRENNPTNWIALRWFVFDEGSFRQEEGDLRFTSDIEIVDPHSISSPGGVLAGWYDWCQEHGYTPIFNRWAIDTELKPVGVEILQPTNFFSSAASPQ